MIDHPNAPPLLKCLILHQKGKFLDMKKGGLILVLSLAILTEIISAERFLCLWSSSQKLNSFCNRAGHIFLFIWMGCIHANWTTTITTSFMYMLESGRGGGGSWDLASYRLSKNKTILPLISFVFIQFICNIYIFILCSLLISLLMTLACFQMDRNLSVIEMYIDIYTNYWWNDFISCIYLFFPCKLYIPIFKILLFLMYYFRKYSIVESFIKRIWKMISCINHNPHKFSIIYLFVILN